MRYFVIVLCFVGLFNAHPIAMNQTATNPDNSAQSRELKSLVGDVQSAKDEVKRLRIDEEKWKGRKRFFTAFTVIIGGVLGVLAWFSDSSAANVAKNIEPIAARREKDESRIKEILDAESALAIETARKDAGEAIQKAEREKLEREKLEAQIAPRRLSKSQEDALASPNNWGGKTIEVKSYMGDLEGFVLATQISDCLKKAGAEVVDNRSTMQAPRSIIFGINVSGPDSKISEELSQLLGDLVKPAPAPNSPFTAQISVMHMVSRVPPVATITIGAKPIT